MHRLRKLTILALLVLTSCSTVRMNLGGRDDKRAIVETKKFYLFGLIGEHQLLIKDYCKNGVSKIKEQVTVTDFILTAVTLGIYAPRTVKISCRI